nr:MAG TPA: hypothetical protein [Caudoviricetes sp.]
MIRSSPLRFAYHVHIGPEISQALLERLITASLS